MTRREGGDHGITEQFVRVLQEDDRRYGDHSSRVRASLRSCPCRRSARVAPRLVEIPAHGRRKEDRDDKVHESDGRYEKDDPEARKKRLPAPPRRGGGEGLHVE